jgi:hypothetical protein
MNTRFWDKVDAYGDCWLWTAYKTPEGYGQFWHERRNEGAHRYAYESLVGGIPDGYELDHLCRVPNCVNPDHLEPVTHRENLLRGPTTISNRLRRRTHCRYGHEYTPENTDIRPGYRRCRACTKEHDRLRYLRNKGGE